MGAPFSLPKVERHTGEPELDTLDFPTFGPKRPSSEAQEAPTPSQEAPKERIFVTPPVPTFEKRPAIAPPKLRVDSVSHGVYDWTQTERKQGTDLGALILFSVALLLVTLKTKSRRR